MPRSRSAYACTECGARQPRWLGRCPACGAWSSLVEEPESPSPGRARLEARPGAEPLRLGAIETGRTERVGTGLAELDRVLGGGLVPGSVVLLGGEPGIGKSTLALQAAAHVRQAGRPVLYVSGEESAEQIRLRAARLDDAPDELLVLVETRAGMLIDPWRKVEPALLVVDSIQTLQTERVESAPGSVAQVRECAAELAALARETGTALLLVGHVTKEGSLAGPRVLEHLVDAVLLFEGDRGHPYRLLRAVKNRFGSTQEVGVFAMTERGLEAVENPSELFLAERRGGAPGSCVVPVLEGTRPLLLEIQALAAPSSYASPRRTVLGVDEARVALLLAVLARHGGVDLLGHDVYVNVTGGVRVAEPAADLAVALALASSRLDRPLPADVAAVGELGLGGEVRRVGRLEARVREAARLGFGRLLLPRGASPTGKGTRAARLLPMADVAEAVAWLRASSPVHETVNAR